MTTNYDYPNKHTIPKTRSGIEKIGLKREISIINIITQDVNGVNGIIYKWIVYVSKNTTQKQIINLHRAITNRFNFISLDIRRVIKND